ncbi:DUF1080 domain-containing protein [Fulvivirgaceae bacterium BMA12]|uniref:DUF1080 domain-containing protein n=1 Tax=Agaribacillus aureus TaxID=3051825 RepID=A0ABT8L7J4_9BACT|nr:DUF1080 domain-containing protein [Fulvivirgaceae bacterium BMA12]
MKIQDSLFGVNKLRVIRNYPLNNIKIANAFGRGILAIGCSLLLTFGACQAPQSTDTGTDGDGDGFVQIFDGKTLDGWEGDENLWRVEDGKLIGEITPATQLDRNSFIIWKGDMPADFELKVEFKISKNGNSGINYRSERVEEVPYGLRGYQADLDGQKNYTGSNYEERRRTTLASQGEVVVVPAVENADSINNYSQGNQWTPRNVTSSLGSRESMQAAIKDEDWNEYHLIVNGNRLQHKVNGVLISDVTDNDTINLRTDGLLGVQVHVGPPMKIAYKNFRLKALK